MPIINQVVKGGGTTPTGTKQITTNGIHDVAAYANADVQVPTTAPAHYVEKIVDGNGKMTNTSTMIDLTGVTDFNQYCLSAAYRSVSFPQNTVIDLSGITSVSGEGALQNAFTACRNIASIDLSSLVTVTGLQAMASAFASCPELLSVDLSSLTTVSGQSCMQGTFSNCGNLSSVDISALTTVSGFTPMMQTFNGTQITSIDFASLTTIGTGTNTFGGIVSGCLLLTTIKFNKLNIIQTQISASYSPVAGSCRRLESVEFGGLTASTFSNAQNQLQYLFDSYTATLAPNGCTVHFPSNFDPSDPDHTFDASTLTGYPTFGGDANYIHVAFDLPATE